MANTFSFDKAAFHFAKADGPSGFLVKYLLAYGAGVIAIAVLSFFALQPFILAYLQAFAAMAQGASDREIERQLTQALFGDFARLGLGYLLMLIIYAAFWAMIESAVLRRYVREEGFNIGWGGDEWRMLAVGLSWIGAIIVAYIAFILGVLVLVTPVGMAMQDNPGLAILWSAAVMVALGIVWIYFAVKLSPAGAMTIRDQKVTFFGAWGASKGRFWPMLGAFIVLAIILYIGILVLYLVGGVAVFGTLMNAVDLSSGQANPDEVVAMFASPAFFIPLGLLYFALLLYQGFWQYAWAGIPALAAKTDPRTGGMHNAADAF